MKTTITILSFVVLSVSIVALGGDVYMAISVFIGSVVGCFCFNTKNTKQ